MSEEKPLIIGDLLQKKRELLGLSINEVASTLKVKKDYIAFLENENFTEFDKNFYTKALIKSYAKLLKIDNSLIEDKLTKISESENKKGNSGLNFEDKDLTPDRNTVRKANLALFLIIILLLISLKLSKNNINFDEVLKDFYENHLDSDKE